MVAPGMGAITAPAAPGASLGELADELAALERRLSKAATEAPVFLAASAPEAVTTFAPVSAAAAIQPRAVPAPESALGLKSDSQAGEPVPVVDAVEEVAVPSIQWTLDRLRVEWLGLIEKLQSTSLNLATGARDAELASFDAGTLNLRVANPYQRKILDDAAERARLEQALSDLCSQPIKVHVSYVETAKKRSNSAAPSAEEDESLLKSSPELRKVQEMFGAQIIEIRQE